MDARVSGIEIETVESDRKAGTVRTRFDQEKTPASMAVIATVAAVMDADPVELEPLHSSVDPDALDALVRVRPGTEGETRITFTHESRAITVSTRGVVTLSRADERTTERGSNR